MEIDDVAADLETLARQDRPLAPNVTPGMIRILDAERYAGVTGHGKLVADILAAIQRLPERQVLSVKADGKTTPMPLRHDAQNLFPRSGASNWGARLRSFDTSFSPSLQKWYAHFLCLRVAHELLLLNQDSRHADYPQDAFVWASYYLWQDVSCTDIRRHTVHRLLRVKVLLPDVEVLPLPVYYDGGQQKAEVFVRSPRYSFLGSRPYDRGGRHDWQTNYIHLGDPFEVDDEFYIRTRETFVDAKRLIRRGDLHLGVVVRHPAQNVIDLAIRLPPDLQSRVAPEWNINARAHTRPRRLEGGHVEATEAGWFRRRFESPHVGLEYRIDLPGLDLYRNGSQRS